MAHLTDLHLEFFPYGSIAAVFYDCLDLSRKVFLSSRHHDGCRSHGKAEQQDPRLSIFLNDPSCPVHYVPAFGPAHSDVVSLALAKPPGIRRQDMVARLPEADRIASHIKRIALVAMADNDILMALFLCRNLQSVKFQAIPAGYVRVYSIGAHEEPVLFLFPGQQILFFRLSQMLS